MPLMSLCDQCPKINCEYKSERKTVCNLFEGEKLIEFCSEILQNKC